jgi:glycosyltransferase involved in cell wall biosynthesis
VPVPPPAYGGIEQVVATLAEGLVERGHEVVLVAAPGSVVSGATVVSPLGALPDQIGEPASDWRHALAGLEAFDGVDVVFDHSGPLGALLTSRLPMAALHVTHGPLDAVPTEIYAGIARQSPRLRLVAISDAQRATAPGLPFAAVCHNGLPLEAAPFRATPDGYLAFLGRMSPEKGAADAIRIARRAGLPLLIGAKCREPAEHAYFAEHVAPELGPDVTWLGELDTAGKYALIAGARALLFPIDWSEPFGMVMIEAMACGTPVLATAHGSVPEVVADGLTGFVRATPEELVSAVARIDEIDRRECRRWVAERFSADAMTAGYLRIARAELARRGRSRDASPALAGV